MLMVALAVNAMGQTIVTDSLAKIALGSRVDFVMDFSGALIHDYSESDFARYEKDWKEDKPSVVRKFRSAANLVLDKELKLGDYPEAPYRMVVTVKSISKSGFMVCDVTMASRQGAPYFRVEDLKGSSDSFFTPGTKLARIKVWSALTGRALGRLMKDRL